MKAVYVLIISVLYAVFSPLIFDKIPLSNVFDSKALLISLMLGVVVLLFEVIESKVKDSAKLTMFFLSIIYFFVVGACISNRINYVVNVTLVIYYIILHLIFIIINRRSG